MGYIGDCFEIHATRVLRRKAEGMLLVHGVVTGKGKMEGIQFRHCWLEKDGYVYDYSNDGEIVMPTIVYYGLGLIADMPGKLFKYTTQEARKMMCIHGHFGDWELTCAL